MQWNVLTNQIDLITKQNLHKTYEKKSKTWSNSENSFLSCCWLFFDDVFFTSVMPSKEKRREVNEEGGIMPVLFV